MGSTTATDRKNVRDDESAIGHEVTDAAAEAAEPAGGHAQSGPAEQCTSLMNVA
jgi:hypothetical protein